MYHPYCHSPSALTEYLKHRLRLQRAKRLGRSLPAQAEPDVQPERNTIEQANSSRPHLDVIGIRATACCHGFFVPTSVIDFQKGEKCKSNYQ